MPANTIKRAADPGTHFVTIEDSKHPDGKRVIPIADRKVGSDYVSKAVAKSGLGKAGDSVSNLHLGGVAQTDRHLWGIISHLKGQLKTTGKITQSDIYKAALNHGHEDHREFYKEKIRSHDHTNDFEWHKDENFGKDAPKDGVSGQDSSPSKPKEDNPKNAPKEPVKPAIQAQDTDGVSHDNRIWIESSAATDAEKKNSKYRLGSLYKLDINRAKHSISQYDDPEEVRDIIRHYTGSGNEEMNGVLRDGESIRELYAGYIGNILHDQGLDDESDEYREAFEDLFEDKKAEVEERAMMLDGAISDFVKNYGGLSMNTTVYRGIGNSDALIPLTGINFDEVAKIYENLCKESKSKGKDQSVERESLEKALNMQAQNAAIGRSSTMRGVTSASTSSSTAHYFGETLGDFGPQRPFKPVLAINTSEGLPVKAYSSNHFEDEILLNHLSSYTFKGLSISEHKDTNMLQVIIHVDHKGTVEKR